MRLLIIIGLFGCAHHAPDSPVDGNASTDGSSVDGAPGTMTFASPATCATTPCQPGTGPNATGVNPCTVGPLGTNVIGLGMINNGSTSECRIYGYYRPKNLVGKATAIFTAGGAVGTGCPNIFDGSNWFKLADENRLVVILLNYCPRGQWYHPYLDVPDPGPTPSDGPYLAAVIQDATNNPNIGIDPARLILTGGSSGGSLTWGIACDPTASSLFAGYAPVSAAMQVQVSNGNPVAGTERCPTTNQKFFLANVHGTADTAVPYSGKCVASHCITSVAETEAYWSKRLGCTGPPSPTMFGTPQATNLKDDYGGCGFGAPPAQYEAVTVTGGGHQWPGLDNASNGGKTNGFDTARTQWDFFATRSW